MISLVVFSIFVACYIFYLWNIYSYWKKRGIIGPTPWPIVGNYGPILFRWKSEDQLIDELYEKYPEEKCIGIFIGTRPALILRDIEMIKLVLNKDFLNFPDKITSSAVNQYDESVFLIRGNEKWKHDRTNLLGLYSHSRMTKAGDAIEDTTSEFLDHVDTRLTKSTKQDIFQLNEELFFSVAYNAVLGMKKECGFDKDISFQRNLRLLHKYEIWEFLCCFELMFPWMINIFKYISHSIANFSFSSLLDLTASVVKSRQSQKSREMYHTFADLLVELQEQKNSVKEGTLNDNALTLHLSQMISSLTVIASKIASHILIVMAQYPHIQKKCYEEINQVLQKYDGKIRFESVYEMKYFDMVIQEVMRARGSVLNPNRICNTKYRFPGTNLEVDPGTLMLIPLDPYRRDPKHFPNPDEFIPERFAPDNLNKLPLGSHVAFGYGRRNCIGKPLSMYVIKMLAAAFLHRFKVEPDRRIENFTKDPRFRSNNPRKEQRFLHIVSRK